MWNQSSVSMSHQALEYKMQLTKVYFTNFMHICQDAVKKTAMRIEESFPLCASLCSVSLCETFFMFLKWLCMVWILDKDQKLSSLLTYMHKYGEVQVQWKSSFMHLYSPFMLLQQINLLCSFHSSLIKMLAFLLQCSQRVNDIKLSVNEYSYRYPIHRSMDINLEFVKWLCSFSWGFAL